MSKEALKETQVNERLEIENIRLRNELSNKEEKILLLKKLTQTQAWLINEYQKQLDCGGHANMNTR